MAQPSAPDLDALELRAQDEFNNRDCVAAEKSFGEALQAAHSSGETHRTGVYYLRIGLCRSRIGDFAASLDAYQHALTVGESTGDDQILRSGIHGAALQLAKMGRIDEALPLGQREYDLARKTGNPDDVAHAMWLMGVQYLAIGRTRDSLEMMNRALVAVRDTADTPFLGVVMQQLAIIYLDLGDVDTAGNIQGQLLAMPEKDLLSITTTYSPAISYSNMGTIQMEAGHRAEARKSFETAIQQSTGAEDWRVRMDTLLDLADIQNDAGEFEAADAGFRDALSIAKEKQFPELQSGAWQMRSDHLLLRGDIAGALEAGAESLRLARQVATPRRVYRALSSFGAARAAAGEQASARENFDEALTIAETLRAQSPAEVSDLGRSFANFIPLYQASVRNLIELHLSADALGRAEQSKARVLMDILLRGGVDERGAMTPAESAEQDRLRKRLAIANAASAAKASAATTRAAQDASMEFRQFRRALYEAHPELAVQTANFEPAGLERLAALINGPNTALLDYFLVPSGVELFVIRRKPSGAAEPLLSSYFLADPKHTLADEARKFREKIASRDLAYKDAARHLFNRLLAPAMSDLRGTTEWIVSPDGALWDVPFAALVDNAGRNVVETRSVSMTPSLTAALRIHERTHAQMKNGIRLLALGNPLPSPVPLPDAVAEVTQIGAGYPRGSALILTGTAATVAAFREKAPAADIIHLAAHAGLNDSDPLSSFVSLGGGADGTLTALDVMSLHLRAEMVVLSACETARGSTGPGEGMIGMGWALSAAGASSSVLSLWKVDSAATREFMTSFYTKMAVGGRAASRAGALRQAELEMLQSKSFRHPFFWAAFSMWGDGTAPLLRTTGR